MLKGFGIESLNVDTAFLYGKIDHKIYVKLPLNATLLGGSKGPFCGLFKKSLYGLKQAPRIWARTLYLTLKEFGFKRMVYEHSIFYGDDLIIAIYVDDLLIIGRTLEAIAEFKRKFRERYRIKDIGPIKDYLGI